MALIVKNYGFLWDRNHIKTGHGGHLKGKAKSIEIDFSEQIGVYVLYDEWQHIVYVGQAGNGNANLLSRLKNHMSSGALWNRWKYFSWIGFSDVNKDGSLRQIQSANSTVTAYSYANAMNEMEGILIELIEPKLNKQGGKLSGATEYFQIPRAEDLSIAEIKESVSQLDNRIEQLHKSLSKMIK